MGIGHQKADCDTSAPDVALVITTLMVGGAERFVVRLANQLCSSLRVEIWVLCGYEPRPLQAVVDARVTVRANAKQSQPSRILWTIQCLRQSRPRVVQSFLWEADFVCAVAARATGYSDLFVSERGDRWTTRWQQRLLDRIAVFPAARAAIANSSASEAKLLDSGWHRGEIAVIHNGLPPVRSDRATDEVRATLNLSAETRIVGMVARMVIQKGWLDLVEASVAIHREHPDTAFIAVGGGPHMSRVEEAVAERSLSAAWHFCGSIENPADYVQLFDVACLPSMREACPNVILEYMALGKAIVAARAGGIPELVVNGDCCAGLLTDPGDVAQLTEAIMKVLSDPDLLSTLRANALSRSRLFTIAHVAGEYTKFWGISDSGVPGAWKG